MRIVTVNAGSTSVKLRVVDDGRTEDPVDLGPPGPDTAAALDAYLGDAGQIAALAHRVVHGGDAYRAAVVLDDGVRARLEGLAGLAPLHNPPALAAIDAARAARPDLPAVACFDTAFHATLPPAASTYALPDEWRQQRGVRRFGFHGLSCAWSARRVAQMVEGAERVVVCHLGGGASVTAIAGGRSVDTTMGFTPLSGLVMATRSGDVDPGALLWMLRNGLDPAGLDDLLEHRSGLAGLSGGSGDMRAVLEARRGGDPRAGLALDVYQHRLRAAVAAMAAALGGVDCLVFTGGVGEHADEVRAEACAGLAWMGVGVDQVANGAVGAADATISPPGAAVTVVVIHAEEDLQMAGEAGALLGP